MAARIFTTGFWIRPRAGLLVLALLAGGTALRAQDAPQVPKVTTATARITEMVGRVPVSGTLVARREVLVFPEVSGFSIRAIDADIGDRVSRGAVLAELDPTMLRARLAQADAELARAAAAVRQAQSQIEAARAAQTQAESALARSQRLQASGNVSQASHDQAVARAQSAQADLAAARDGFGVARAQQQQMAAQRDIARLNLARAKITAPAGGLIAARTAQLGAIASAQGPALFTLIENGEIEMKAGVIETSLSRIRPGDVADLNIAGIGPARGVVRRISPIVDARTRLGSLRISITSGGALKSGLYAGGWIITERRRALSLPLGAVISGAAGPRVLVVASGVVREVAVKTGLIWQGRREIVSGLAAGDTVIATAGAFFHQGDRVQPVAEKAAPTKSVPTKPVPTKPTPAKPTPAAPGAGQ